MRIPTSDLYDVVQQARANLKPAWNPSLNDSRSRRDAWSEAVVAECIRLLREKNIARAD